MTEGAGFRHTDFELSEGQPVELSVTQFRKGVRTKDVHLAGRVTKEVSEALGLTKKGCAERRKSLRWHISGAEEAVQLTQDYDSRMKHRKEKQPKGIHSQEIQKRVLRKPPVALLLQNDRREGGVQVAAVRGDSKTLGDPLASQVLGQRRGWGG